MTANRDAVSPTLLYVCRPPKRTDLEGIKKLTYLKSLLEGDALKLVEGLHLESHYYKEAVKTPSRYVWKGNRN